MSYGLKLYAWKNTIDYNEVEINYLDTEMNFSNIPYYENSERWILGLGLES